MSTLNSGHYQISINKSSAPKPDAYGHLHPAVRISKGGNSTRRPCFASDGIRLIMPAFGVTTGGLTLNHKAFSGLFTTGKLDAHVLGRDQIYPIHESAFNRK